MADVLFECPRCDAQHQKPRTLDCLREHIARVHLDNLAVFSCPRCCTTFVNPEMAHHHIRMECQVEGLVQVKDYTKNILSLDFNYLAELQQVENEALALRLACPPPGLDLDDLYMLSKAYGYKLVKDMEEPVKESASAEIQTDPPARSDQYIQVDSTREDDGEREKKQTPEKTTLPKGQPRVKKRWSEVKWKAAKKPWPSVEVKEEIFGEEDEEPTQREVAVAPPPAGHPVTEAQLEEMAFEKQILCRPCKTFHPEDTKCPLLRLSSFFARSPVLRSPLPFRFPLPRRETPPSEDD